MLIKDLMRFYCNFRLNSKQNRIWVFECVFFFGKCRQNDLWMKWLCLVLFKRRKYNISIQFIIIWEEGSRNQMQMTLNLFIPRPLQTKPSRSIEHSMHRSSYERLTTTVRIRWRTDRMHRYNSFGWSEHMPLL